MKPVKPAVLENQGRILHSLESGNLKKILRAQYPAGSEKVQNGLRWLHGLVETGHVPACTEYRTADAGAIRNRRGNIMHTDVAHGDGDDRAIWLELVEAEQEHLEDAAEAWSVPERALRQRQRLLPAPPGDVPVPIRYSRVCDRAMRPSVCGSH
jgi:hypothetical protein